MSVPETLLAVRAYNGEGYKPLIDYGAWRVAILRYIDELLPEKLDKVQRHAETDEVFVLLAGRCILFLSDGTEIYAQDMEPYKLYNVKRGSWHTHTLSQDAIVLIVENCDTTSANSPQSELSIAQRTRIIELTCELWPGHAAT